MHTMALWAAASERAKDLGFAAAQTAELEPYAPGDELTDRRGGVWRVVGLDVMSNIYLLKPNAIISAAGYTGPERGYSPFELAREVFRRGSATWQAGASELRRECKAPTPTPAYEYEATPDGVANEND